MVSVIIPAYNAEKTIEKAVESVLNQTEPFPQKRTQNRVKKLNKMQR